MTTVAQPTKGLQIFGIDCSLKALVNRLENAIIIISGPAIAISGIIAGIDLLTGGTMFKDVRWLSLTWAICLLLTLDFQVLVLGARAKQTYDSHKSVKRKIVEIALIILIASGISSVSVQMQSIIARTQATTTYTDRTGLHVRNLTIDEATHDMGINPVALIWERSALVLVLIFMSGWFRDEEKKEDTQSVAPTAQPTTPAPVSSISEQDMQRILAALSEVASLKDEVRQLRTTVQVEEIAGPVNPATPAIPEQAESIQNDQNALAEGKKEDVNEPGKSSIPIQNTAAFKSYGPAITTLLESEPDLTVRDIAARVKCSIRTANLWQQRIQKGR